MTEQKEKALKLVKYRLCACFGPSAVMPAGELMPPAVMSTGIPELDAVLGVGGIPMGKIVEIYGPDGAGKTALALHIAKQAQNAMYIDADHGLSPVQLADCENLYLLAVDKLEDALQAVIDAAPAFDVIVLDTLTALPTKIALSMEMGDFENGATAKLLSRALPRLISTLDKNGCTLVIVNQLRTNSTITFGNPEKVPGGNALKHYAAMRLDVRRVDFVKIGGKITGQKIRIKAVKNKCAAPMRETVIPLIYGVGLQCAENSTVSLRQSRDEAVRT